jgi:hypothetical protein
VIAGKQYAWALALLMLVSAPLAAQNRYQLRLNGTGGFGFGYTNTDSNGFGFSSRDLGGELGLDASGFLYDPRLVNYSLLTFWGDNNTSLNQGDASARSLNISTGVSFLPDSSHPFAIYYTHGNNNTSGDLVPPITSVNTLFGVRGALKKPSLFNLSYNFGRNTTDSEFTGDHQNFITKNRFASVGLERQLAGWELRVTDDYNHSSTNFTTFDQTFNNLMGEAGKSFGEGIRLNLTALRSWFDFKDRSSQAGTSTDTATLFSGTLTWKYNDKLSSNYLASYSRNSTNLIQILEENNGGPVQTTPEVVESSTETVGAGVNYQVNQNLSFSGSGGYSHSSLPQQSVAQFSNPELITTSTLDLGGGVTYRRNLGKLQWQTSANLDWQSFGMLIGDRQSGVGYRFDTRLSGGEVRRLQYGFYYRFSNRGNPIFFQTITTTDNRFGVNLGSNYFGWVQLQGNAEYGIGSLELRGSNLGIHNANFSASAFFPKQNLSITAAHNNYDYNQQLFLLTNTLVARTDINPGAAQLPNEFLGPRLFNETAADRVGVIWRPKWNLQVEGRYTRDHLLVNFLNRTESHYNTIEALVQYKFGRFTIYGGYGRILSGTNTSDINTNRILLRIRFPFHIL